MTERLSDERLRELCGVPQAMPWDEVPQMARELIELRAKLAPLATATPSTLRINDALDTEYLIQAQDQEITYLRAKLAAGPVMPELEWRGRRLFFGPVETRGWIVGDGDRWDGRYGGDSILEVGGLVSKQEARAAVEDAVRKALGWA